VTYEQLEAIRAKRREIDATRERLLTAPMAWAERQLEEQHLSSLTGQLLAIEEAGNAPPPHPKAAEIAKLTPAQAEAAAKAIRERPEYWTPGKRDADGNPALTREQHTELVAEHTELLRRASEEK
jgi:hypothetical protein